MTPLIASLMRREISKADCSRSRVGAVVVYDGNIVGKGHNSLPAGSCLAGDCPRGLLSYEEQPKDVGYEASGCRAVHAEDDALAEAGVWARGAVIYVSRKPCPGCAEKILRAGIKEVIVVDL